MLLNCESNYISHISEFQWKKFHTYVFKEKKKKEEKF